MKLLQVLSREDGCTVLMVTHDNRILDVADRMINLVDGRLESDQATHQGDDSVPPQVTARMM